MKFTSDRHWWNRTANGDRHSLEGCWLPILGVGGVLAALLASAWRFEPAENRSAAAVATASGSADVHQLPAVHIRLVADATGHLSHVLLNGRPVRDVAELRDKVIAFRGPATDATVEAELDCDGNLRYEDTRRTIDAISSYPSPDGRTNVPLVDRVKFLRRGGKQ